MTSSIGRSPQIVAFALSAAALWFVVGVIVLGSARSTLALDPRAAECGRAVEGDIKIQIALDRASDYHKAFPKMGISPELENGNPAFFVVYDGPAKVANLFAAPPGQNADGSLIAGPPVETELTGVVCAITPYGRIIYSDVDTP